MTSQVVTGLGVSPGVVVGPVARLILRPELPPDDVELDPDEAYRQTSAALGAVAAELAAQARTAGAEAADILSAHVMILSDPVLAERIRGYLEEGHSRRSALDAAFGEFKDALAAGGDYFAERIADLEDLQYRVAAELLGVASGPLALPDRCILLARDLGPAEVLGLDPAAILAFVTEEGGRSSHTAIVARSLGLPAVVACHGACAIESGTTVLVDGRSGSVIVDPSQQDIDRSMAAEQARNAGLAAVRGPGRTRDGRSVELLVNIDTSYAAGAAADSEGVGLFRTEMLYLDRQTAPGRSEQQSHYEEVFAAFQGRKVVVRTLDAGADKPLPFIDAELELNPALGVRGIRVAARRPELLADQLAAIAAAARRCSAEVWVMAPMVSTVSEVRSFAASARGFGLNTVGVMAEVPALALRAGRVLQECDFISIGTNDLAQYTFAADRMLTALTELVDPWQPALLELMRITAEAGKLAAKPVGICGEAASDPLLAAVFVGLGVNSLSMSPISLSEVRASLASYTEQDCRHFAEVALQAESAVAARQLVQELAGRPQGSTSGSTGLPV